MEGLVLPVTAFMSFASILWLVVAKLATSGNEDGASSSTASGSIPGDDEHHVAVTVSSSGNIISAKTITSKKVFIYPWKMISGYSCSTYFKYILAQLLGETID